MSRNFTFPWELPETAPPEHSLPWEVIEIGAGHFDVKDALDTIFMRVYCWDAPDLEEFQTKLRTIFNNPEYLI